MIAKAKLPALIAALTAEIAAVGMNPEALTPIKLQPLRAAKGGKLIDAADIAGAKALG